MTLLFLQLNQTVTGNVITIVTLLTVAAIIGYFTAWLYLKSVYSPLIKGLKADKNGLIKQVSDLRDDKDKLIAKVEKLSNKIVRLEEESAHKDKEIKKLSKSKKKMKLNL